MPPANAVAFYTVANANYFLGLAGLVNSLRLLGHAEPVVVVDCGLAGWQRELLEGHVVLAQAPPDLPPHLCAWEGPRIRPAEITVLIDADMIVTRPLEPVVSPATKGAAVVAFEDRLGDRFFPEWSSALDLPEIVHRRSYVNAGLLVFAGSKGSDVLERIRAGQARLPGGPAGARLPGGPAGARLPGGLGSTRSRRIDPFYYPDQDVLNAVLMATLEADELVVLEHRLAPFAIASPDLAVADLRTLRCEYPDGLSPFAVHHTQKKPWLSATPQNAYSELLGRLLLADDVAVRPPTEAVPLRFRAGALAALERGRVGVAAQLSLRDQLRRLRRRLVPREKPYADTRAGAQSADTGDSEKSLGASGAAAPAQKQPGNNESSTGSDD